MVMGRLASKKTNDRINVLAISEFNIELKFCILLYQLSGHA